MEAKEEAAEAPEAREEGWVEVVSESGQRSFYHPHRNELRRADPAHLADAEAEGEWVMGEGGMYTHSVSKRTMLHQEDAPLDRPLPASVDREGWLGVRGEHAWDWLPRFFQLRGDVLCGYSSEEAALEDAHMFDLQASGVAVRQMGLVVLLTAPPARAWYLCGDARDDVDAWAGLLEHHSRHPVATHGDGYGVLKRQLSSLVDDCDIGDEGRARGGRDGGEEDEDEEEEEEEEEEEQEDADMDAEVCQVCRHAYSSEGEGGEHLCWQGSLMLRTGSQTRSRWVKLNTATLSLEMRSLPCATCTASPVSHAAEAGGDVFILVQEGQREVELRCRNTPERDHVLALLQRASEVAKLDHLIEKAQQGETATVENIISLVEFAKMAPLVTRLGKDGASALHVAAGGAHEETLRHLLEYINVDVDVRDTNGDTPLICACRSARPVTIKAVGMLLDAGADVNLLNNRGLSAIHACHAEAVLRLLVRQGADVDVQDQQGYTPLQAALRDGNESVARMLLHVATPDVNHAAWSDNKTALLLAAEKGMSALVCALLNDFGADATAESNHGSTALHLWATSGVASVQAVSVLAQRGCPVNAVDSDGLTALHYTVREAGGNGSRTAKLAAAAQALLDAGADAMAVTPRGRTALHLAAAVGNEPAVRLLLGLRSAAEAVAARDNSGYTPLVLAALAGAAPGQSRFVGVEEALVSHGATMVEVGAVRDTDTEKFVRSDEGQFLLRAADLDGVVAYVASERASRADKAAWLLQHRKFVDEAGLAARLLRLFQEWASPGVLQLVDEWVALQAPGFCFRDGAVGAVVAELLLLASPLRGRELLHAALFLLDHGGIYLSDRPEWQAAAQAQADALGVPLVPGSTRRTVLGAAALPYPQLVSAGGVGGGRACALKDLAPLEVARQLSLVAHNLYCQLDPHEFTHMRFSRADEAPTFAAMRQWFNGTTAWAASLVLAEESPAARARVLKFLVRVADHCFTVLHNYDSLMAIVNALNSNSVFRLKRSWAKLPRRWARVVDGINETISGGARKLAQIQLDTAPPCVPYVGLYLSTFNALHEYPSRVDGELINFAKIRSNGRELAQIRRFQGTKYAFEPHPGALALLHEPPRFADADAQYARSLELEPRPKRRA